MANMCRINLKKLFKNIIIFAILLYVSVYTLYDYFNNFKTIEFDDDADVNFSNSKIFCMILTQPKNLNNKVWFV